MCIRDRLLLYSFCYTRLSLCLYQLERPDDISARVGDDDSRSLDEGVSVVREGIDESEIAYLECRIARPKVLQIDEIDSSSGICILRSHIAIDRPIDTRIVISCIGALHRCLCSCSGTRRLTDDPLEISDLLGYSGESLESTVVVALQ